MPTLGLGGAEWDVVLVAEYSMEDLPAVDPELDISMDWDNWLCWKQT